jgi:hypothetical protein
MKEIKYFEDKVWGLIKNAQEKKDSKMIDQLSPILQEIDTVKKQTAKIEDMIKNIEDGGSSEFIGAKKMVSWEVTDGAIGQNYLSVTKARKEGLVPELGIEFEVETSVGQKFRTDITAGRLRERGEVADFYKKANVKEGDMVLWKEIGPNRYHLSKGE